jgi:hypothetical protein
MSIFTASPSSRGRLKISEDCDYAELAGDVLVGYTMGNDVVDAGTARLRKALIEQRRWIRVPANDVFMNKLVYVICGDTRLVSVSSSTRTGQQL